jgi:hypothetical protein
MHRRQCKRHISGNQYRDAAGEQVLAIDPVGKLAEGIGAGGVNDVHDYPDAINKTRSEHRADAGGERKQRLGAGSQPVAEQQQRFAAAQSVAHRAGK